jgi:hypothetical protein
MRQQRQMELDMEPNDLLRDQFQGCAMQPPRAHEEVSEVSIQVPLKFYQPSRDCIDGKR